MDMQYESLGYSLSEIEHKYGARVHVLANPYLLSHLVKLCDNNGANCKS